MDDPSIRVASTTQDFDAARVLFLDYADSYGLDFGYLDFEFELSTLEQLYQSPNGLIYLMSNEDEKDMGVAAVKQIDEQNIELKRLYIASKYRSSESTMMLMDKILEAVAQKGFRSINAHFIPEMHEAVAVCRSLGFTDCPPFKYDHVHGSIFLKLDLG